MPSQDDTISKRPMPPRPKWGWSAWEATLGYISTQHSPDVTLKLEAYPHDQTMLWSSTLSWGNQHEAVHDRASLMDALRDLWLEVERQHQIFKSLEAASKRPANYDDQSWLDENTLEVLMRLVRVTMTVFTDNWRIVMVYQPVETPDNRYEARLMAADHQIQRGGRGATLRDACRTLYHNATNAYTDYMRGDER